MKPIPQKNYTIFLQRQINQQRLQKIGIHGLCNKRCKDDIHFGQRIFRIFSPCFPRETRRKLCTKMIVQIVLMDQTDQIAMTIMNDK